MELDPVFIRALRLLHSTSKESGMQLKAMLDESIRMKKNPGSAPLKMTAVAAPQGRESHVKETTDRYFNLIHSLAVIWFLDNNLQKVMHSSINRFAFFFRKNLDKLKRDLTELVPEAKKPRLHSPARSSPGISTR